jgi:hypothetical protein
MISVKSPSDTRLPIPERGTTLFKVLLRSTYASTAAQSTPRIISAP